MFSTFRNATLAATVAGLGLLAAGGAKASVITYDFTVTGTTGPLTGTVEKGTFSYDSSSITPGKQNNAPGLLISLSFSWNGVAYTAATANTGSLSFDASGNLTQAVFGSECPACATTPGFNEFNATVLANSEFVYTVPGLTARDDFFLGTITAALVVPAPEPASLTVLALGLAGLGLALRTRRA